MKNIILINKLRNYWIYLCHTAITSQQVEKQNKIFKLLDKVRKEEKLTRADEVFLKSIEKELMKYTHQK